MKEQIEHYFNNALWAYINLVIITLKLHHIGKRVEDSAEGLAKRFSYLFTS